MAQGGAPQDLEMGNIRTPDHVTSPTTGTNGNGYPAAGNGTDAMTAFYSEVRASPAATDRLTLNLRGWGAPIALCRSRPSRTPSPRTIRMSPASPTCTIARLTAQMRMRISRMLPFWTTSSLKREIWATTSSRGYSLSRLSLHNLGRTSGYARTE